MVGSLLFVWGNAALVWLAARLGRRLLPEADGAEHALITAVLAAGIAIWTLQGLALVGWMGPVQVVLVLSAAVAVDGAVAMPTPPPDRAPTSRVGAVAAALGGSVALVWAWALVAGPTEFSWDDLSYHAAVPGWWLRHGTLAVAPLTYQAYYPFNAELLSLWTLLPVHADTQSGHARLLWAVMALAAAAVVARRLGQPPLVAALVWAAAFAGATRRFIEDFTAPDLALAAATLAALALARDDRAPTRAAAASGLAAGLALGIKVSVAPVVALLGAWWLWVAWRRRDPWPALAFAGAAATLGLGWYLRNAWLTGNPLFPAAVGPFEGPFDAAAQRRTSIVGLLERTRPDRRWGLLLDVLGTRLHWPGPVGAVAVLGLLTGGIALWRRRLDRGAATLLALLLAAAVVLLLLHPTMPFSGTPNRYNGKLLRLSRYVTSPVFLLLAIAPTGLPTRGRGHVAAVAVAAATLLATVWWARWWLEVGVGLVVAAAIVGAWWRWPAARRALPALGVAAALLVGVGLAGERAERTERRLFRWKGSDRPVSAAWAAVDALPPGSRVGALNALPGSHGMLYPLMGRRLQHEPVALTVHGEAAGLLHETWRAHPDWWWETRAEPVADEVLVANLAAAGVEYVVVSKWDRIPARGWPWHRDALRRALGRERVLWSDPYSELWDVRSSP